MPRAIPVPLREVLVARIAGGDAWVVRDAHGTELARHPAPELHRDRILALDVAHCRLRAKLHDLPPQGQPYAR